MGKNVGQTKTTLSIEFINILKPNLTMTVGVKFFAQQGCTWFY